MLSSVEEEEKNCVFMKRWACQSLQCLSLASEICSRPSKFAGNYSNM